MQLKANVLDPWIAFYVWCIICLSGAEADIRACSWSWRPWQSVRRHTWSGYRHWGSLLWTVSGCHPGSGRICWGSCTWSQEYARSRCRWVRFLLCQKRVSKLLDRCYLTKLHLVSSCSVERCDVIWKVWHAFRNWQVACLVCCMEPNRELTADSSPTPVSDDCILPTLEHWSSVAHKVFLVTEHLLRQHLGSGTVCRVI